MIVVEHMIRAIIDTIPSIQLTPDVLAKPQFHRGDEEELNRYVQLKKGSAYPLIWLLPSPDAYKGSYGQEVIKECSFIIATRETRQDLFNDVRYVTSFDLVLQPLTDFLIHGLTASTITDRVEDSWEILKLPNYSAESKNNGTIDIWDAIGLTMTIRFKSKIACLKSISYDN